MTPAQQQIIAQWDAFLQQQSHELNQLAQQAGAGCRDLVQQNPSDVTPLSNALGAISQQVQGILRRADDSFSSFYDRLTDAGPGEPGYAQMKRAMRAFNVWGEESWARFASHWQVENYRAMWPHAQAAMQRPIGCSRCGAPITRATPHRSETIMCTACGGANQVMPDPQVARYFSGIPHVYAEQASLDKRFAIDRFKQEFENYRDAEYAADRERPDEPLERLKQREAMERDYWTTYAEVKAKYDGSTPEDTKNLVEARMKQAFYDEVNLNDVWRAAHGMQATSVNVSVPAHLQNVDEWGPLNPHQNPNALEDNFVHDILLNEAMRDPQRYEGLVRQLGYRDPIHRAMVHATFRRYYSDFLMSPQGQALMTKAAMRAMSERGALAVAAGQASGLMDPIEGVSLQVYANLQAKQPGLPPEQFQHMLAQYQMDHAKWERVQKGWIHKMSTDTSGAVATEYSKAFMSAGHGQFGAAGVAAASAMGAGSVPIQSPSASAEPVSFDRYCEISGAMAAWSKQGKDISAGLDRHFKMTAMDFSNISMYWSSKMMQDLSMFDKQSQMTADYEQRYLAQS